tara:strand:+ start:555 stop:683 length:129 start_codon:yes stop_codon:yes gene_type:complete
MDKGSNTQQKESEAVFPGDPEVLQVCLSNLFRVLIENISHMI